MKIALASDHGGLNYKNEIIKYLKEHNHIVFDCGTNTKESTHYPIYAKKACEMLVNNQVDRIILVCTTGEGVMMTANRYKGIRCGLGYSNEVVSLMRHHNDANAIAFGEKFMNLKDVLERVDIFLNTPFDGGRHFERIKLIEQ